MSATSLTTACEQVQHNEEWDEKFQCIHCLYYEPLLVGEDGGDVGVFCCFTNTGKSDRVACGEWVFADADIGGGETP